MLQIQGVYISPEWPDTVLVLLIEKNNSLFVMSYVTLVALTRKASVLQCHRTGSQVPTWSSAVFYHFSAVNVTYISFEFSVNIR